MLYPRCHTHTVWGPFQKMCRKKAEAANRKLADAAACKDAWVWLQVRLPMQI